MIAALVSASSAQRAPDSLAVSRAEATDRALASAADLGHFQAAVRAASALERVPLLVSNPVLGVESEGRSTPFSSREYTRRISLDQEIDLRGQRRARRSLGQATVSVAERDWAARKQAIEGSVDEAYGRWLTARHRIDFLEPLANRAREMSGHADAARRREIITGFDARVLRGDVAELDAEQVEAQRDLEQADAELRVWMGIPVNQPLRPVDDLDGRSWQCAVEALTALAQRERADLARAGAAESLAAARWGLERRLTLANPSLGITAGRERRSFESSSSGTLEDQATILGIRASIPLPLARATATASEAQVEWSRAQGERARLDLTVRQEVAAACARLARAQDRRELLQTAAASAASDLRLTESAYREGRIPLEQYLTVRERLVRIQREALDAAARVEEARSQLVRATGTRREVLTAMLHSTER